MKPRAPTRRPLWWWLFGVGLVQLVLLVIALVVVAIASAPRKPDYEAYRRGTGATGITPNDTNDPLGLVAPLRALADKPAELQRALGELQNQLHIDATIYDRAGNLIATNTEPALPFQNAPRRGRHHGPRGPKGPPPDIDDAHDEHAQPSGPPPDLEALGPGQFKRPDGPHGHGPPPLQDEVLIHAVPFTVHGAEGVILLRLTAPKPSAWILVITFLAGVVIIALGTGLTARWLGRPIAQLTSTAQALGAGDLTARANLNRQDELGTLGQTFDDMAVRIAQLLRSEKELLANVAHELRTPLARIRVAVDIASEGDAAAARASLGEIAVDLPELEALVDDVLTTTRLAFDDSSPAHFVLRRTTTSPVDIANVAATRCRSRWPSRQLNVTIADALPELFVDDKLVRRVIDNLLDNAHKYSPDVQQPIDLAVSGHANEVRFAVTDRGSGIPAEDLQRVFDPFYRGEKSRVRSAGGVGLGLTLAKRIVDAHGGTLTLQSEHGKGTVATLILLVAEPSSGST
jgi:signal transduction histidine kinase